MRLCTNTSHCKACAGSISSWMRGSSPLMTLYCLGGRQKEPAHPRASGNPVRAFANVACGPGSPLPRAMTKGRRAPSPVFFTGAPGTPVSWSHRVPGLYPARTMSARLEKNRGRAGRVRVGRTQVHASWRKLKCSDPRTSTPRDVEACRNPVLPQVRRTLASRARCFEVCSAAPPVDFHFRRPVFPFGL
jgi:hypothetical protein